MGSNRVPSSFPIRPVLADTSSPQAFYEGAQATVRALSSRKGRRDDHSTSSRSSLLWWTRAGAGLSRPLGRILRPQTRYKGRGYYAPAQYLSSLCSSSCEPLSLGLTTAA